MKVPKSTGKDISGSSTKQANDLQITVTTHEKKRKSSDKLASQIVENSQSYIISNCFHANDFESLLWHKLKVLENIWLWHQYFLKMMYESLLWCKFTCSNWNFLNISNFKNILTFNIKIFWKWCMKAYFNMKNSQTHIETSWEYLISKWFWILISKFPQRAPILQKNEN